MHWLLFLEHFGAFSEAREVEMQTLKRLVTSRKFVAALVACGVTALVQSGVIGEELSFAAQEKLVDIVVLLASVFIGATALEDGAEKLFSSRKKDE